METKDGLSDLSRKMEVGATEVNTGRARAKERRRHGVSRKVDNGNSGEERRLRGRPHEEKGSRSNDRKKMEAEEEEVQENGEGKRRQGRWLRTREREGDR